MAVAQTYVFGFHKEAQWLKILYSLYDCQLVGFKNIKTLPQHLSTKQLKGVSKHLKTTYRE